MNILIIKPKQILIIENAIYTYKTRKTIYLGIKKKII